MSLELKTQEARTKDGLYVVTFTYPKLPLDQQEAAFVSASPRLVTISPAQLGYFRHAVNEDNNPFAQYSRTSMEVFYDIRDGNLKVVLLPESPIREIVGNSALVNAHRRSQECVVSKEQMDLVYDIVDTMKRGGKSFVTTGGFHDIPLSDFDKYDITSFMYTDEGLGAKPQDVGDWLKEGGRTVHIHRVYFDNEGYALEQGGSYLNRVRLCSAGNYFIAGGDGRNLDDHDGAFGVFVKKSAEGGAK